MASEKSKNNEISITRIYDAPVKLVWDAWTDPKKVAKWWGPRGFTLTTHSKDLRVGGHWAYTMHGPDGTNYENKTIYHEVVEFSRLVYDHGGNDDRPPLFRVTAVFTDLKGKTKLEMTMAFATGEVAKEMKKFIKAAGGESTWDRLAEFLGKEIENKEKFVINRSFEAPIEKMFEMWTNPKHFSQWLAPTGFKMIFLEANIKTGGQTRYSMSNDSGMIMYGRAQYIKVERPNYLQYTQQFCDKDGNVSRHPAAPTWPETMITTVTLHEEGSMQTRVTIEWEVYGKATKEELETFIAGRSGMTQGWGGSFDKLEEYLLDI